MYYTYIKLTVRNKTFIKKIVLEKYGQDKIKNVNKQKTDNLYYNKN